MLLEVLICKPNCKIGTFSANIHVYIFQAIAGNIITASPISDLNPLFLAMGATLQVHSKGDSINHTDGANLTFKSIFHKALNLFYLCEITLESVPGTNQYYAIRVQCLAQGNNRGL